MNFVKMKISKQLKYKEIIQLLILIQFFFVEAERPIARHLQEDFISTEKSARSSYDHVSYMCEPIDIEYCKNIGYNFTRMPNTLGFNRQIEVEMQLKTYEPLVQIGCSQELHFFLCAVFAPMCHTKLEPDKAILPCEGWCRAEQSKCKKVMKSFGIEWPKILNCSQFPAQNGVNDLMCMEGKQPRRAQPHATTFPSTATTDSSYCRYVPILNAFI